MGWKVQYININKLTVRIHIRKSGGGPRRDTDTPLSAVSWIRSYDRRRIQVGNYHRSMEHHMVVPSCRMAMTAACGALVNLGSV